MRKHKNKTEKQETHDLEFLLNDIVRKLHNVCYPIDLIKNTPVRFMYVSQHEDLFTTHFKSNDEEFVLKMNVNDINMMTSEELTGSVLKQSTIKMKDIHSD